MTEDRKDVDGRGRESPGKIARLSAIITILPASMAAGWMLGYFVFDRLLGTSPWGGIIFTLIGAGTGFYEIIRILTPGGKKRG